MRNPSFRGVHKKPIYRGVGGGLHKKRGLRQFVDLKGALQKKGEGMFLREGLIHQYTLWCLLITNESLRSLIGIWNISYMLL